MKLFRSLLSDPPPALAFEISEAGIAVARLRPRGEMGFQPFKTGVISVSPLHDNVLMADEFQLAVRAMAGPNGTRKRREATVIIPDYATRIAVLDFDEFPSDRKEQLSLIRFRARKSVPFDVESAAVSYWPQHRAGKKNDVLTVIAPVEIISRYEAPFRAAGLNPGLVTPSSIALLDLITERGLVVVAKVSSRTLTVIVLENGHVRLVRCLELGAPDVAEIAGHLYSTFVYIEDQLGSRTEKLLICGFGERTEAARQQFQAELEVEVEPVRSPLGLPAEHNAGLLGYMRSVAAE